MNTHSEMTEAEMAPKRDKGFTLVELLIVIVILGVLSTVTVFAVSGITSRGEDARCDADKRTVEVAAEAYYAENGAWPAAMSNLVPGFIKSDSGLHAVDATTGVVSAVTGGDCA